MGFKDWNINDLAISLNAIPLDDGGYADDEVFSLEWDDAQFLDFTGADGEVSRYATNNFKAFVTLGYANTANANDRTGRILPDVKFSFVLQGAVHKVLIYGTVRTAL